MTSFYLEKVGLVFCFVFFLIATHLHPDHACAHTPPTPRHPTRELRGLQFENHDGDARRLA